MVPVDAWGTTAWISVRRSVQRRYRVAIPTPAGRAIPSRDAPGPCRTNTLPSAQRGLGFSDAQRQWVVTAYTVCFAGLLLFGGRVADTVGRRRSFQIGLAGFGLASVLAGLAPSLPVLAAGRALQGTFAALIAPTVLSLLAVTFTDQRERTRAFAIYGAVASSGAAAGLVSGGLLTDYLDWRWCLFVNVAIAGAVLTAGHFVLPDPPRFGSAGLDATSAVLAIGGLAALVF